MTVCTPSPTLPTLHSELVLCLQWAYDNIGRPAAFDALRRGLFVIETMALTTSEFGLLRNRMHNALRYSLQEEWGAARFELRLLLHSLAMAA